MTDLNWEAENAEDFQKLHRGELTPAQLTASGLERWFRYQPDSPTLPPTDCLLLVILRRCEPRRDRSSDMGTTFRI